MGSPQGIAGLGLGLLKKDLKSFFSRTWTRGFQKDLDLDLGNFERTSSPSPFHCTKSMIKMNYERKSSFLVAKFFSDFGNMRVNKVV